MSDEPKKNDDLNERVTARIQDQLMLIMPEEDIRRRVDMVVDNFFAITKDRYDNRVPSKFSLVVEGILKDKIRDLVIKIFDDPSWKVSVDENMQLKMGAALQVILGITPDALRETVAQQVAKARAMQLAMLITNNLRHSGAISYEISNAIDTAVNTAIQQSNNMVM